MRFEHMKTALGKLHQKCQILWAGLANLLLLFFLLLSFIIKEDFFKPKFFFYFLLLFLKF